MGTEIGILIGVILAIAMVVLVVRPLQQKPLELDDDETQLADLQARREAAYQVLRDLDNDFTQGKLTEDDYRPMRVQALAQAAEIVAQLDKAQLEKAQRPASPATAPAARPQSAKERSAKLPTPRDGQLAVSSVPNAKTKRPKSKPTQRTSSVTPRDTRAPANDSNAFCPSCGAKHGPDDAFCRKCGKALHPQTG